MAKPKTKAAVKKKPAKPQVRAAAPAKAPKKVTAAKSVGKAVKASPVKAAKAVAPKTVAAKAPVIVAAEVKPAAKPRSLEKAEMLTLPNARQQAEAAAPKPVAAPAPAPVIRKVSEAIGVRADLPPADGFTLLVDGHFKNQFGDLKGAKAAASELKTRFPMLRIEIYDAASKARLPA